MPNNKASLLIIFLVVFIDLIGFGIVIPILPYYAHSFGASGETLGWLMASYSAAQFLCAPFWGRLSDHFGRRPVLIATMIGSAASLALTASASSLTQIFIARILAGLFGANISTASAYIADVTSEADRAKGMGLIGAAFGIGFVVGPAVGGILSRWGYATPFLFASGLACLNTLFAIWKLREPPTTAGVREINRLARRISRERLRTAFGDARTRLAIVVFFLGTVAIAQLEVTFALYMKAMHGFNAEKAGWYLAFMGLAMAVIQGGLIGKLSRKFGERRLIICGTFIMAGAMVWFASLQTAGIWAFAALGLLAVGNGITNPSLSSLASKGALKNQLGATMGVYQSAGSLARILAPPMAGVLYDRATIQSPFYCAAILMAIACVGVFFGSKQPMGR
ncbi:MAG TPA: MFS transporter [Oligoflexia bacterium]|nr:MFS transporter [Oligoflexia bacterium]